MVQLAVTGMSCAACAAAVERRLLREPGVLGASVNLASAEASVRVDGAEAGEAALIDAIRGLGYDARAIRATEDGPGEPGAGSDSSARRLESLRLAVALGLALPVFVVAMAHGRIVIGSERMTLWMQALLSAPVVFWCGWPFIRGAVAGARRRRASMDTLVALGAVSAWVLSAVALLRAPAQAHHTLPIHFESGAVVVALVLLGKRLEARATRGASSAVARLISLSPRTARLLVDGREVERPAAEIRAGDMLVVRPGERFAADGRVTFGASAADESMLTGESVPVEKGPGDDVRAGTLNTTGVLHAQALRPPGESTLSRLVTLMREAQSSRVPLARFADRLSAVFVPIVLGLALVVAGVWLAFGPEDERVRLAVTTGLSVLVVSCPCALGLATPIVVMVASGRLAERGIVLRRGAALEHAGSLSTILLDKTGTITYGRLRVVEVASGVPETDLARLALTLERGSEHPIARGVLSWAGSRVNGASDPVPALAVRAAPGAGLEADSPEGVLRAGSLAFLASRGVHLPAVLEARARAWADQGRTLVGLARAGSVLGVLALADEPRPEAREAVARLEALGLTVRVLSGDSGPAARGAAGAAGIAPDRVEAPCNPEGKLARLAALQASGERVGMAGDGINDAPALARADVGFAMGAGADVAVEAGDMTLLRDDLRALPESIELSRRAMRAIRRNLAWAFGYNIVAIPVAAGALYPAWGILLSPMIAGGVMALSSLSVVISSLAAGAAMKRSTPAPG